MEQKKENIHADHRERMKQRFIAEGLEHFDYHNILELLLFFAIPRKDTNPIAHELIQKFGSFSAVFSADVQQLQSIKGMTRGAAILIKMIPEVYRKYAEDSLNRINILNTSELVGDFLLTKFIGRPLETVGLICLNNSCKMLKFEWISEGSFSSAPVNIRKIAETAFSCNAVSVILAHNHPNGGLKPSHKDIRTTETIKAVLKKLDIDLLDHFIVAEGRWSSMMEEGYLGVGRIVEKEIF